MRYDLGFGDVLVAQDDEHHEFKVKNEFKVKIATNDHMEWVCVKSQIPALVTALRDLGHITEPDPEPLLWYTVERHGQPALGVWFVTWTWAGGMRSVTRRSGGPWHSNTRYLPLDHLRGHTELPGWDDVAPASEPPELPEPWLAVSDEEEGEYDFLACYAVATVGGRVLMERQRPKSDERIVAWCAVGDGEEVPPHPYARAE